MRTSAMVLVSVLSVATVVAMESAVLATIYVPVDLTPAGLTTAYARGAAGGQQVGYGYSSPDNYCHALLWRDSAHQLRGP